MSKIIFFVPGIPATQGSKRPFVNKKTGKAIVVEDCKQNRPWRTDVKAFASEAYDGPLLDGPLRLTAEFRLPRPKGHYGSGRNAELVKPNSPAYPNVKPDLSKLTRALEDALKGVIWLDDSQVVAHDIRKVYALRGQVLGAHVEVEVMLATF